MAYHQTCRKIHALVRQFTESSDKMEQLIVRHLAKSSDGEEKNIPEQPHDDAYPHYIWENEIQRPRFSSDLKLQVKNICVFKNDWPRGW